MTAGAVGFGEAVESFLTNQQIVESLALRGKIPFTLRDQVGQRIPRTLSKRE